MRTWKGNRWHGTWRLRTRSPQGLDRVQSAAFQKDRARRRALQQWNDKWLMDTLIPEFNVQPQKSWGGSLITPSPLSHHHPPPPHTHMTDTTPSGWQPPTRSVMRMERKPKHRSSHGALRTPDRHRQTTPSQALTSSASALTTPPKTSVALVGNPSDPWSTSSSTARDLSNHASHSPSSARGGIPSTPSSPTPVFSPPEEGLRRCASIVMCEVRNQNWQMHGSENGWD
ncbi:hypothetical protein EDB84DRAFT_902270 [Lactarius hengduanensis]|nr:hypothetical protein EDB84DRAFT_902270 [Lactarius hengduanensis]